MVKNRCLPPSSSTNFVSYFVPRRARAARQHIMRVRLCALLALVSADGPKIPCQSGQENDLDFAACSDYCTESHHCAKCKCR